MLTCTWRWDRIVPVCSPGMASENPSDGQIQSPEHSMNTKSLYSILGTGRNMPATYRCKRTNCILINFNRYNQNDYNNFSYCQYELIHLNIQQNFVPFQIILPLDRKPKKYSFVKSAMLLWQYFRLWDLKFQILPHQDLNFDDQTF